MAACQPGTCCCECHGCSGVRKVYKITEQHFRGCFLEFNNLVSRVSCDRRHGEKGDTKNHWAARRQPGFWAFCTGACKPLQIGQIERSYRLLFYQRHVQPAGLLWVNSSQAVAVMAF